MWKKRPLLVSFLAILTAAAALEIAAVLKLITITDWMSGGIYLALGLIWLAIPFRQFYLKHWK